MDIQAKIEGNRRNIWQAVDDYHAHTYQTYVLDSVSEKFVNRLAEDNAYAKAELRDLFRKSPRLERGAGLPHHQRDENP